MALPMKPKKACCLRPRSCLASQVIVGLVGVEYASDLKVKVRWRWSLFLVGLRPLWYATTIFKISMFYVRAFQSHVNPPWSLPSFPSNLYMFVVFIVVKQ